MTHFTLSHTTAANGVQLYTLRNHTGMRVTISNLGASMINWWAPDRYGREADVLLGFADVQQYQHNPAYFGAIVGRWGNRIAAGRFNLDGVAHQVDCNEGEKPAWRRGRLPPPVVAGPA